MVIHFGCFVWHSTVWYASLFIPLLVGQFLVYYQFGVIANRSAVSIQVACGPCLEIEWHCCRVSGVGIATALGRFCILTSASGIYWHFQLGLKSFSTAVLDPFSKTFRALWIWTGDFPLCINKIVASFQMKTFSSCYQNTKSKYVIWLYSMNRMDELPIS